MHSAQQDAIHLANVPFVKGDEDRSLVWEVLIHGSDTHACSFGNPIGCDNGCTPALDQFGGGIEHSLDRHLSPFLGGFSADFNSPWIQLHFNQYREKCELSFNFARNPRKQIKIGDDHDASRQSSVRS